MNAMLNINVRVASQQALAQLKQLNSVAQSTNRSSGQLGGTALNLNQAFKMGNLEKFGKNLQWTGRQLEYNFTLPLVLAGAASTKWALDNETALTTIRKAYGAFDGDATVVKAEVDALTKSFELLSNRFGIQQKEVLTIAADWAQAGAAGVGLAKAVQLTMETMILGQQGAEQSTEDLLTIQSAYGLNTDQLRQKLEALNAINVTTAIEFGGLVDAVSRAAGAAKTAGIDIEHLGAMAAALVPATGSAAAAGNALRTIISRLLSPTNQAAEELALMGINVEDASWQAMNGVQRFETLAQSFATLSDAQKAQVSSIIASRWQINRFDILMEDIIDTQGVYQKALANSTDATKAHSVYTQQLATVLSSTPQGFKILTTNIQNALAKAIVPLLPALTMLLSKIVQLVTWFTRLSPETQQLALAFLFLLAAVGPVSRYIGSFTLLFTVLGKAVGFARLMTIGMTEAQLASAAASGVQNVGFIHQYGIIGGLVRVVRIFIGTLLAIPFRAISFGFEAIWAGFHIGIGGAWRATNGLFARILTFPFAAVGASFRGMWFLAGKGVDFLISQVIALAGYLSGPFLVTVRTVGTWIATSLPRAAQAAMSAAGTAATFVVDVVAGGITAMAGFLSNGMRYFVAIVNATGSMTQSLWAIAVMGVQRLWAALLPVVQAIGGAITTAWQVTSRAFQIAWVLAQTFVIRSWYLLQYAAVAAGTAISAAWNAAARFFQIAWVLVSSNVQRMWFLLQRPAVIAANAIGAIWAAAARISALAWAGFMRVMAFIPVATQAIWKAIVITWRTGITVLKALQTGFAAFSKIMGLVVAAAWTHPWIAIVAAVVVLAGILIYMFRDEIVGGIIDAFNALPSGLKNALITVATMIRNFAQKVAEWLSYLNPFARHSPSLVDNVTRGVSTILDQYSRLSGVPGVIREAVAAQREFNAATANAKQGLDLTKFQQQKSDIIAVSPDAGPSIDRLIDSIFGMQDGIRLVNEQLIDQQRLVDDMQRQIDQDMKPYNDAIFDNEMAQKRLRLELLKMDQAGQSIDDIRERMAALSGEIESMRSEQAELRAAGAGSDVLAAYDQQIDALEAQREAMEGIVSPAQALQDELDKLQLASEQLNLEKDIQFDPQLRLLDEQKDKLTELGNAYGDINTAIRDMESNLTDMASAAKAATDAAEGNFNEKMFDAAAGANFEDVGGDTIPGLGKEGDLIDIEQFNAEMQAELDEALAGMGSMDMFAPIKDMWNSTWGWIKDNVGPVVQPVLDGISNQFAGLGGNWSWDGIKTALGNLGTVISDSPLGGVYDSILMIGQYLVDAWTTIWGAIQPVLETVWGWVKYAGEVIGDELKNWAPMFDKFLEAITHVYNVVSWFVKVLIAIMLPVLAIIVGVWKAVWPVLKNVVEPIFKAIVGIIRAALEIIRGVISFVLDLINGDWGKAWEDILTIVDGVWDAIYEVIRFPIDLIIGLVKGLVEGIVGFFTWLWDVLVGHSIIPDLINDIIWWFNFLTAPIRAVWELIWQGIQWLWDNVGKPIFEAIKIDLKLLGDAVTWLKEHVWDPVWDKIGGAVGWVYNNLIKPMIDAIKIDLGLLGDALSWLKEHVWDPIWNAMSGAVSSAFGSIVGFIQSGINLAIDAFNFLARAINAVVDALHLPLPHIDERDHIDFSGASGTGGGGGAVRYMARGGMFPLNNAGFVTNIPTAIVGEGSSHAEFVIPTDPKHRRRALQLFAQLGTRLLDAGDVIGGAADFAGGVLGTGKDFVLNAVDVAKAFWDAINKAREAITSNSVEIIREVISSLKDGVIDWGEDQLRKIPGVGTLFDISGGILDAGKSIVDAGGSLVSGAGDLLGNIPGLASGGIVMPRPGGTLVNVAERGRAEMIKPLPSEMGNGDTNYNFYGDLSFPNITKPDDAKEFIRNLKGLGG